jgi:type II secretory pathway predicted ATPase ExeA
MVRDPVPDSPPPFTGSAEPANFHRGPAQEEALARLEWLVAERQRCGLVVAAAGMGKSHLVVAAARRLGGLTAEVAILSLRGLPEGEWIDLLLDRLPLDAATRAEPLRPWLKLENRLRENTLLGRPTVLMFDDLDRGPADARSGIARLAAAAEARFATTVIVATATPAGLGSVPEAIRQRAAVRIELFPWSEEEVAAYLADGLVQAGRSPELWSAAAAATIQRFAAGVPAVVRQLAHLCLAAADSGRLDCVDAGTVETVWRELVPAEADGQYDQHDQHDQQAAEFPTGDCDSPRVRVVRRLWG